MALLPAPALPGHPRLERGQACGAGGDSLTDSVLKLILVPLIPPALVLAMTRTEYEVLRLKDSRPHRRVLAPTVLAEGHTQPGRLSQSVRPRLGSSPHPLLS